MLCNAPEILPKVLLWLDLVSPHGITSGMIVSLTDSFICLFYTCILSTSHVLYFVPRRHKCCGFAHQLVVPYLNPLATLRNLWFPFKISIFQHRWCGFKEPRCQPVLGGHYEETSSCFPQYAKLWCDCQHPAGLLMEPDPHPIDHSPLLLLSKPSLNLHPNFPVPIGSTFSARIIWTLGSSRDLVVCEVGV